MTGGADLGGGAVDESPVAEGVAGPGAGTEARAMVSRTPVMISGFSGMCGAQMPAR